MIISVAAQKGGCGKTTTAISIAAYLARKGKNVLIIDLDGQCNTSFVLLKNYTTLSRALTPDKTVASILDDNLPLPIYDTIIPTLKLVPSHANLSDANSILPTLIDKERRLLYALEEPSKEFDYIIIDCPPDLSFLPYSALVASDYVLIPSSPSRFDLQGLKKLIDKVVSAQSPRLNPKLKILGHLMTLRDQTNMSKEVYETIVKLFGDNVFKTQIPRNVKVSEANSKGLDIFAYAADCPAALAYKKLIETEILPKLSN